MFKIHTSTPLHMLLTALCFGGCLLLWPSLLVAQEQQAFVTLTQEQIDLNNAASAALNQEPPDAATAIKHLEEALKTGKAADILYMSLGRAYQYKDQCASAEETFTLAESTPSLQGIPHDVILKKIARYREESAEMCSGDLTFMCQDATVQFISGENRFVCGERATLAPGAHRFEVRRDREILGQVTGLVVGTERRELDPGALIQTSISNTEKGGSSDGGVTMTTPPPSRINGYDITRYVSVAGISAGGFLIGMGVYTQRRITEGTPRGEFMANQVLAMQQRRNRFYWSGAGLATGGTIAILTSLLLESRRNNRNNTARVTPYLTLQPDRASLDLSLEF